MSGAPTNISETLGSKPVLAPAGLTCPHCGKRYDEPVSRTDSLRPDLTAKLSDAQRKILAYLLEGLTEPQIAEKIHRSRHTVHDHTKAIYAAIGVKRRVQLVKMFGGQSFPTLPVFDERSPS